MVDIDTNDTIIKPPWYQEYMGDIDIINMIIKPPWYQ